MNILCLTEKRNNQGAMTNGVKAAMAMQRLGHVVTICEHKYLSVDIIKAADLIIAFGTLLYPYHTSQAKWIFENKRPGVKFALWYFDACNPNSNYGGSGGKYQRIMAMIPYLDWLFTTDHSHSWEKHIKNYGHLLQGVDPDDFKFKVGPIEPRQADVIFTGCLRGDVDNRERPLQLMAQNYTVARYGRGVYGSKFFAAHQKARVVYVPPPPIEIRNKYWSNRIYLAAGTGTPCLVGYTPGIEDHYKADEEVIYFKNDLEMRTKLILLLGDEGLRKKIGNAGRIRTLRDHTYQVRCKQMLEIIK